MKYKQRNTPKKTRAKLQQEDERNLSFKPAASEDNFKPRIAPRAQDMTGKSPLKGNTEASHHRIIRFPPLHPLTMLRQQIHRQLPRPGRTAYQSSGIGFLHLPFSGWWCLSSSIRLRRLGGLTIPDDIFSLLVGLGRCVVREDDLRFIWMWAWKNRGLVGFLPRGGGSPAVRRGGALLGHSSL